MKYLKELIAFGGTQSAGRFGLRVSAFCYFVKCGCLERMDNHVNMDANAC